MGKKHKKHKSERRYEEDGDEKPALKIVLKLQEGVYDSDYAASPASYSGEYSIDNEKSHKKKKKKKRHSSDDRDHHSLKIRKKGKRDYEVEPIYPDDNVPGEVTEQLPGSAPASPDEMIQTSINLPASPEIAKPVEVAVKKRKIPMTATMRSSLDKLLERLLNQLERKDPHEIFAWPVNDIIAPGYSDVIANPMDFSTMRKKIARHQYSDVDEFKSDFKLMTDNCCTYNRPETIFYESAKKLYAAGFKILSKERLLNMKRTLGFLHDLSKIECAQIMGLPLPQEELIDVSMEVDQSFDDITEAKEQSVDVEFAAGGTDPDLRAHPDAVSFTDADNEETVAPDVLEAARQAKERLARRRPKSKMGFLRIDDVGKTTFNFINPDLPDEQSDVVDLGSLTGRLPSGMETLPEAKEDKRNKVTPLTYLGFGPFGSFAPTYDSRIANITQEESDLLLAAYGGETEYLFAKSMHTFVKDSEYDLVSMVDDLLDTLTHGAHKSTIASIKDKRKKAEEEKLKEEEAKMEADVKIESVEEFDLSPGSLQEKLDLTGELVSKLEKTQNERLSENPPPGLPNLKPPSDKEQDIATKLRENLSDLITQAKPEDVCSVTGVRKAIGVEVEVTE